MGYSYYASATFPVSARNIKEIEDYLDGDECREEVEEEGSLICVSNQYASSGELDITDLLEEHKIPYDHYHRDDNACSEWTALYRLDEAGNLVEVANESDNSEAVSDFAKEVLKALEAGNTEKVYALLDDAIIAIESIEDIASKALSQPVAQEGVPA